MADALTDRLSPLRPHAATLAVVALLAGVVYCQTHGQLTGVRAPLGVSLWWSACAILPSVVVVALALRLAARIRRAPAVGAAGLAIAFVIALAVGDLAYAGALGDVEAWRSSAFRAAPLAAVLSAFIVVALPPPRQPPAPSGLLPLPEARRPIRPGDLSVVRSAGNYLALTIQGRETLVRLPLHEAARRLAPHGFVRAHRTALVNLGCATTLRRSGRRLAIVLDDGAEVRVGRAFVREVQSRWSQRLRHSSQRAVPPA